MVGDEWKEGDMISSKGEGGELAKGDLGEECSAGFFSISSSSTPINTNLSMTSSSCCSSRSLLFYQPSATGVFVSPKIFFILPFLAP